MPRKVSDLSCPDCGGPLDIVTDGMIGETYHPGYHVAGRELPTRWRLAPFAACSSCEFCVEIRVQHAKQNRA